MEPLGPHRYVAYVRVLASVYKKLSRRQDDSISFPGTNARHPCGRITMLNDVRFYGAGPILGRRRAGGSSAQIRRGCVIRATGSHRRKTGGPSRAADPTPKPEPCVQAGSRPRAANGP